MVIKGYSYDQDTVLEVAAVLRRKSAGYEHLGSLEGNGDKSFELRNTWSIIRLI